MKFLLGPYCIERKLHEKGKKRLEGFFSMMHFVAEQYNDTAEIDWEMEELTQEHLDSCNLLIIANRMPSKRFKTQEIEMIEEYVMNGGNLLVIANHGPDLMLQDSRLLKRFGMSFGFARYQDLCQPVTLLTDVSQHIITCHPQTGHPLKIAVETACFIDSWINESETIVHLNDDMDDFTHTEDNSIDKAFAAIIDRTEDHGKIAAIASAGVFGDPEHGDTGPGLAAGDNQQFVCNLLHWLVS